MLITQPYKGTILIDHPMRDKLYLMKFKKNIYFFYIFGYNIDVSNYLRHQFYLWFYFFNKI